jgi:hypothetical protein
MTVKFTMPDWKCPVGMKTDLMIPNGKRQKSVMPQQIHRF